MVTVFVIWALSLSAKLEPVPSLVHWRLSFFEPSFQFWRKKGLRHRFFLITSAKNVFLSSCCSKNNINNNHFSISLSSNADKPPRNDSLSRGMLVGLLQVDFSKEIMQHLMQQSAISSWRPSTKILCSKIFKILFEWMNFESSSNEPENIWAGALKKSLIEPIIGYYLSFTWPIIEIAFCEPFRA